MATRTGSARQLDAIQPRQPNVDERHRWLLAREALQSLKAIVRFDQLHFGPQGVQQFDQLGPWQRLVFHHQGD
jgi:hypothetical protein